MEQANIPAPKRKKSKFKVIALPIIIAIVVLSLLISLLFWIFSGASSYYMSWGPQEITFYSQIPIDDFGNDDWFDDATIDNGFNDSVYNGSLEYSKYKNDDLKTKSAIGIANSIEWSVDDSVYINPIYGIDAQYAAGAKTVVTAGFNLANAFRILHDSTTGYSDEDFIAKGWKSIVLDDSGLAMDFESAISVYYDGADAGFLAGIAASVYTASKMVESVIEGEAVVASDDIYTWGGAAFDTVYGILSGFEQGINYFNYKVFGIDADGNAHEASGEDVTGEAKTLGLLYDYSTSDGVDADIADGLDMVNGYALTPDYTKAVDRTLNASDITEANHENSWYAGTFDTDVHTDAGKAANEKAENAVVNNIAATFPVAGGQYTNVTQIFSNNADTIDNSKVIGVDVDGTEADSAHSEFYLGSAIKNIKDSASLAIWKADGENGNPTFGGISSNDFETDVTEGEDGWKVSTLNGVEPKGELYKGTYLNGGVGFVEGNTENGGKTSIENSYQYLVTNLKIENAPNTFKEFAEFAYDENMKFVGAIENSSHTFTAEGVETLTDKSVTPWIPNWFKYQ